MSGVKTMNNTILYDVVYIGNYTKDTITSPSGVRYVDGGAVNYAAHAAARLGFHVAVVTHLAKEDTRVVHNLQQAGIDCYARYTPQSTCVKLEYPTLNPDIRNLYITSSAGTIGVDEIAPLQARKAVIGTTVRGEVNLDMIQALKEKKLLLAADMQGFVRVLRGLNLVYEPWNEMETTLNYVDILKADSTEAEFLTGTADIYQAAQFFAHLGPKEIVLTHKDGLLIYAEDQFHEVGFYPQKLNGRSGRGDTCLGSYVAMRLANPPRQSCIWAAAVTSLKMETLGPFNRSIEDVEALIREKYQDVLVPRQDIIK
jgi:sugar/nucleoside kinase (ribokinase family)